MNKTELEEELYKLKKRIDEITKENTFLLKEQKRLVKMAESAGSELAPYKSMVMRLHEELDKLDNLLKSREVKK